MRVFDLGDESGSMKVWPDAANCRLGRCCAHGLSETVSSEPIDIGKRLLGVDAEALNPFCAQARPLLTADLWRS